MAAKLTKLIHKIVIQLHLVAETCIICSSRSRRPVLKLSDPPSYKVKSPVSKHHFVEACKVYGGKVPRILYVGARWFRMSSLLSSRYIHYIHWKIRWVVSDLV